MTTIAVTAAIYNEEKNIDRFIKALLNQTKMPDEIVIVNDGSTDNTLKRLEFYESQNSILKVLSIKNSGPARARNIAWKHSSSDLCLFTDGDCVPEKNWIEKIVSPFESNPDIGAVGGTYKTLNETSMLATFIGEEIAWKYKDVKGEIDVHGSYNLAVRRDILEEVGGFNDLYLKPSGEDWDLTYKISENHKIIFKPDAIVGHYHPEFLFDYLLNQLNRSSDRIKIYNDHPDKRTGDTYTPTFIMYQIIGSALVVICLLLAFIKADFKKMAKIVSALLLISYSITSPYFAQKGIQFAFYSIFIQFIRTFFWGFGILKGIIKYGYKI